MADVDPVGDAVADLATRPERTAAVVLDDLRPAMGRARLHRRLQVATMTVAAATLVVGGGLSLRSPTEAQQVQIADESAGPEVVRPFPETTVAPSGTTVVPPTTVGPTTVLAVPETTAAAPTIEGVPAPDGAPDPTTPSPSGPVAEPKWVPATSPPARPPTSPPAVPPPPASASTVVIEVSGAGTITVEYTSTAITGVEVATIGGSTYEIEDRTVHEVKVEFEGGGPKIDVEIHLEDGEITYQIGGDESGD